MKFIITTIFIIILSSVSFGQFAEDTIYYFTQNTVVKYDTLIVMEYIRSKIDVTQSINGKEIIMIPTQREFKSGKRAMLIDGYLTQYSPVLASDITLTDTPTEGIEINLKTKKIKYRQRRKGDDTVYLKPTGDTKEIIKKKLKERYKKNNKKLKIKDDRS